MSSLNPMPLVASGLDVWVATSRRYQSLSTVILGDDETALVIDPNWDDDELASIPAELAAMGVSCGMGLSTHMHYDQSPRRAPQVAEPSLACDRGR